MHRAASCIRLALAHDNHDDVTHSTPAPNPESPRARAPLCLSISVSITANRKENNNSHAARANTDKCHKPLIWPPGKAASPPTLERPLGCAQRCIAGRHPLGRALSFARAPQVQNVISIRPSRGPTRARACLQTNYIIIIIILPACKLAGWLPDSGQLVPEPKLLLLWPTTKGAPGAPKLLPARPDMILYARPPLAEIMKM